MSEVRYSPYNSPFVPAGDYPGVIWVGREYRDMPHSAHVYHWQQHKHLEQVQERLRGISVAVQLLPELQQCADEGIKASARRALALRQLIHPNKGQRRPQRLLAKKSINAQIETLKQQAEQRKARP